MKKTLQFMLLFTTIIGFSQTKGKQYRIRTIAFYNLENLFDTINDINKNDEFSPIMELKSNRGEVYVDKIDKLASVIAQIGKEKTKTSPAIIGVCEVENLSVLEDLIQSVHLKKKDYGIIHYDSPDKRGIDVALLYQKKYFKPVFHEPFNPNLYKNNRKVYTRDQLLVTGYLDDELIHIIVNHWPSKRGGISSVPLREKAAYQNIKIIDQLIEKDSDAKIFIIGDFNDDPIASSFKKVLKTKAKKSRLTEKAIYNPYESMFKKGLNTTAHRDHISLFDQILISSTLVDKGEKDFSSYKMYQAHIFNKRFLVQKKDQYKEYPLRSFSNGLYTGGYSDHFPVYMYVIKEEK